jgi:hypothetical protein
MWSEVVCRKSPTCKCQSGPQTHRRTVSLHCVRPAFDTERKSASIYGAGVEPSPLLLRPVIGLLYEPCMIDGEDCAVFSGRTVWQGKPKCPHDRRGGKPVSA